MKNKKNITSLDLSDPNNILESIPEEVFGLKKLEILNMSGNSIKVGKYYNETEGKLVAYDGITEEILNLSELKELNLSSNDINSIPKYLTKMATLEVLDLSSNNIKKIPKDLSNLVSLKKLNLEDNPVSQIKGFSLNKSPKEIIEFLF